MSYKISAQCMTDKNLKQLEPAYFFRADQAENATLGYMYSTSQGARSNSHQHSSTAATAIVLMRAA